MSASESVICVLCNGLAPHMITTLLTHSDRLPLPRTYDREEGGFKKQKKSSTLNSATIYLLLPSAATKAIEECNGKCVPEICEESATMSLQRSLTKAERKDQIQKQKHSRFAQQAENSVGGLYVGNLADDVDDAELREAFSKFGELVRAQVCWLSTTWVMNCG